MSEKTVLITGCSSGFGLGAAQAFLARGWQVIAGLRDPGRAPAGLAGVTIVPLDLEDDAQIHAAAAQLTRLDCLVNNAGYALAGPFSSYACAQMQRQLQVALLGPALLTQALLVPLTRARGRIINVSSLAGETGMPMNALYCAAKHAVEGWSEALRHELEPHGIQVALIEPGGFRTRFGENMEWGKRALPPDSVEANQLAAFRALHARILARPGRAPAPVVAAIVRLAEMRAMPLRTRIGGDARMMRQVKRWLAEGVGVSLMAAAFRRRLAE